MKKFFLVSVLTVLAASQAHASKARLLSLQKAEFLKDSQTVFENPAHVNSLGQYLTFEFGDSTTTGSPKAEGGLFMKEFGGNVGVYLGHKNEDQVALRGATFENQNNPVELFYGKDNWGASVSISNHEDKNTDVKEQSLTARFGVDNGDHEYYVSVDLISDAETATDEYTGGPLVTFGYEKEMGTNYLFVKGLWGTAETEIGATKTDIDMMGLEVGILSRKIANIYYGVSLSYLSQEFDSAEFTALTLPVFIGIEADLNTWATVRASVTQSILLSSVEDETSVTAPKEILNANDTTVSAGIGFKYNKFVLDGVVSASRNGQVNGNDVLTSAALTYNF